MDPYGHHHHHHHHHRDESDEDYSPPPQAPPYFAPPPPQPHFPGDGYPPPPPPHATNVYHSSHVPGGGLDYPPPPPRPHVPDYYDSPSYAPPPPPPHVSHNSPPSFGGVEIINEPHHHRPHVPSIVHGHTHTHHKDSYLENKPSVRVYSKAETNYSLTIRDGKVILARSNPSDPFQHWVKDEKFSIRVKDEEGFPSFALVNKATGLAMKHSIGATHPVQLTPYNPDILDESVLWTESRDLGDSYRTIRMVNNIRLNVDAFNGDENHGGVRDGTTIVLWEWKKGGNQRWKIVPYCKSIYRPTHYI